MSGGNQQKVVVARWARTSRRVLILDEPTRGVDVGAKMEIYRIMQSLADQDFAILMISSELPEIVGMSDRVIVMREGQVSGILEAIGLINGIGVVVLRVHPLIVTLGMGAILQGITLLYALGPVGAVPDGFDSIAYGTIGPIPAAGIATVLVYALLAFFLRSTRFGRYIYAVGDDANAAKLIGLPRTQVILFVYAFSGFFAAGTAIYLVALFGLGQPYAGTNYTLASITPAVVGGTVLSGGRGGVMGTLFGTYLVSLLNNLLNFLDVDTYVQLVVQGLIIILAVSVYVENRKSVA